MTLLEKAYQSFMRQSMSLAKKFLYQAVDNHQLDYPDLFVMTVDGLQRSGEKLEIDFFITSSRILYEQKNFKESLRTLEMISEGENFVKKIEIALLKKECFFELGFISKYRSTVDKVYKAYVDNKNILMLQKLNTELIEREPRSYLRKKIELSLVALTGEYDYIVKLLDKNKWKIIERKKTEDLNVFYELYHVFLKYEGVWNRLQAYNKLRVNYWLTQLESKKGDAVSLRKKIVATIFDLLLEEPSETLIHHFIVRYCFNCRRDILSENYTELFWEKDYPASKQSVVHGVVVEIIRNRPSWKKVEKNNNDMDVGEDLFNSASLTEEEKIEHNIEYLKKSGRKDILENIYQIDESKKKENKENNITSVGDSFSDPDAIVNDILDELKKYNAPISSLEKSNTIGVFTIKNIELMKLEKLETFWESLIISLLQHELYQEAVLAIEIVVERLSLTGEDLSEAIYMKIESLVHCREYRAAIDLIIKEQEKLEIQGKYYETLEYLKAECLSALGAKREANKIYERLKKRGQGYRLANQRTKELEEGK